MRTGRQKLDNRCSYRLSIEPLRVFQTTDDELGEGSLPDLRAVSRSRGLHNNGRSTTYTTRHSLIRTCNY